MKSFLIAVSGASAFNMNVPKSVVMAAVSAPTVSSAERTFVFPPLTFLSAAGDYAARVRSEVIDVFAPGIIDGIGAAYYRHVRDMLANGRDLVAPAPAAQWIAPEHDNLRGAAYFH